MSRPVNKPQLSYTIFQTTAGWMALLVSPSGLRRLILPRPRPDAAIRLILSAAEQPATLISPEPPDAPAFISTVSQLISYFHGKRVRFMTRLDFNGVTDFQRRVWTAAYAIPYGETRTYAWLARQAGSPKGQRAVGQALGANPLPLIIPCHRVVRSDGSIGGFSDGIKMKQYLLKLEGISQIS